MSENVSEALESAKLEIERLNTALRAERIKTQISSEYTNFGLWEYDIATDVCYQYKKLNGKYEDILDPIVRFYDTVMSWGIVHTEDRLVFKKFCDAMKAGEKEVGCDVRVIGEFNDFVWFRYEGKTVFDDNGKPVKVVGRTLDVTQEKGGSAEASYARKDPLTKTPSHEIFREFLAEKRGGANNYNTAAFLCVGIDGLREIKARCGADYSNHIQKTVADILMGVCSTERDSAVTRVREGEFLLYLGFDDPKTLDDTALRIVTSVRDHIYDGEPVTASVGVSIFKNDKKPEDVYGEASVALADAVRNGGGRVSYYSLAMSVRREPAPEINFEIDAANLSVGAAKVYNYIIKAFCSPKERHALVKKAFNAAGQSLGAAVIFLYEKGENGYERSVIYNADDRPEELLPGLEISCSPEELSAVLGGGSSIRIHCADIQYDGLVLTNGAVCAECRATSYNGVVTKVFAVVFDGESELGEQDAQVLDVLENALTSMYNSYEEGLADRSRKRLRTTIISNHRMEGFSIIPGKFIIDDVGDNAAEHYDLCKGDICYKKMRGLDAPCENCPAVMLDQKGTFFESSALYYEKERRWLDVAASVDENLDGERRYVISSTDITDCLGRIQMTDRLTGLMTFNVFTAEALRLTAMEESTQGLYTIVINVADFARINEEKGYETGDAILVAMADILQRCIGEDELLCRSEDSRFTALLRNTELHDFQSRMSLMLSGMQKQVYDKLQVHLYFLVGVCDMGEDPVGIMGAIDRAITAQKTIRDRSFYNDSLVAYYDGVMREKLQERRYIESSMMEALANNEFCVYYQPKVNIETGKVVGAEALVRWIRANGDIISPGKFVPIFEENGFITEMDFAIYRHAVADIARWLRMDIEVPLISLNVSRRHLADDDFCSKFNNLVDGLGVPHEYIELEITESLLTENLHKLVDVATWFKERGYRISIDDFGSGYSSLNLITMMPFDTLKIDGGFFLRNDLTDKNKKVITSVVSLAKSLNLETVSEGVETQTQVDFLKDLGCDMIQGFFYYKPMPGADFEQVIAAQNKKA